MIVEALVLSKIKLNQIKLNQIKLNQIKLNQIKLNQIKLNQIKLNQSVGKSPFQKARRYCKSKKVRMGVPEFHMCHKGCGGACEHGWECRNFTCATKGVGERVNMAGSAGISHVPQRVWGSV